MAHLPVVLALGVAAGVLAGLWWPQLLWPGGALGLAGSGLAWAAMRRRWTRWVVPWGVLGVAGLAAVLGSRAFTEASRPSLVAVLEEGGFLEGDPRGRPVVRIEGRLTADAAASDHVVLLRVAADRVWLGPCGCPRAVSGQVQVAVAGTLAVPRIGEWRAGRRVAVAASVRRPTSYRNHGAPDAALDLIRRRVALVATAKSALLVEVVARGSWIDETAAHARARARVAIARATGPEAREAAAVGTAVLVGDRAGLDPALTRRLQRAGTFHVIAISGGNIALLTLLTLWALGLISRARHAALVVAAGVLLAYAVMVGGGASVLRATGMALVAIAARLIDQRGAAVNVLAATAGLLLAADPLLGVDVGFWLTCAATGAMIVGLPLHARQRFPVREWARALLLTSLWAELGLLPIITSVFQQVTVAGLVLNPIAIPGMALAQMAAMFAVFADVVAPALAGVAGLALRAGASAVVDSASFVDRVPWLAWRVPPPDAVVVIAYYAALGAWVWLRSGGAAATRTSRRVSTAALAGAVCWVAVAPTSVWPAREATLTVTALDVGQGDALLVRFPDGTRMLVDAGGRSGSGFDVGDRVVGPALRARGVRRLDYLVVTHADADHVGGAAAVVREFRPAEVWVGVPVAGDAATAELRAAAHAAGAAWRETRDGDRLWLGDAQLSVLHPAPADWERQAVRNDDSVVLLIRLGGVQVLLTGDIGDAGERMLTSMLPDARAVPVLTVLKVAHHGSAGGSSAPFLGRLRPAVALVSAGTGNPFGHPAPAVLHRLSQVGADVWRTDIEGEVSVRTDGRAVEIVAFSGRRRWLQPQPR